VQFVTYWNLTEWQFVLSRSGDDLFSVAVDTAADAQALAAHLRDTGNWLDVVPGIASVVVRFDAALQDGEDVRRALAEVLAGDIPALQMADDFLEIPVVYGGKYGPDLRALCKSTGLSREALIESHTGADHTVDMIGFTPGFAFVSGLDERFLVPRRDEPRQSVAAGSVGIADGRTGLYAMASPGGWNIIGRTPYKLFDPNAQEPFALSAGMRVRFKAIETWESDV